MRYVKSYRGMRLFEITNVQFNGVGLRYYTFTFVQREFTPD